MCRLLTFHMGVSGSIIKTLGPRWLDLDILGFIEALEPMVLRLARFGCFRVRRNVSNVVLQFPNSPGLGLKSQPLIGATLFIKKMCVDGLVKSGEVHV